jgi:hypothetical protein
MPTTVGLVHAIVLVAAVVTVIKAVLCALLVVIADVYTMSVAEQYVDPDIVNYVLTVPGAVAICTS